MYQAPVVAQRRTNGYATASFILGAVGLALGPCLLFAPNILAVVFGHRALREVRETGQDGRSLAVAGLWMGYVLPALAIFGFLLWAGRQ